MSFLRSQYDLIILDYFKVKSVDNDLWFVAHRNTEIQPGDVLKLGRIQMEFISSFLKDELTDEKQSFLHPSTPKASLGEERLCKICYDTIDSTENPLLSCCLCQGSLKYSHLNCTREWMRNKVRILEKNDPIFVKADLSDFRCEVCMSSFNFAPKKLGQPMFLLDFLSGFKEFIVFRIENTHVFLNYSEKSELTVGRGFSSGYRLDDSTVSRQHCKLSKGKGSFFVEDLGSKFGTLIKMRRSFVIESKKPYHLQRHNTVFSIKRSERKRRMLDFCFCGCS